MSDEATVIVRSDREKMFANRHPWLFSGAVQTVNGDPANGDIVALRTTGDAFLGRGYWNRQSQINVHILTWDEAEVIDDEFWRSRLHRAIDARAVENATHKRGVPNAYRLVNAENDGL